MLGLRILLVYENADRLGATKQQASELRHTAQSEALRTLLYFGPNTFKIDDRGSISYDICLEDELSGFNRNPGPTLFNAASAPLAKTFRVSVQWVDPTFVKSHLGLYRDDQLEIGGGCESEAWNFRSSFDGPSQLEEQFTAGAPHMLTSLGIVIPKLSYAFAFTHDHMTGRACLCDFRESFESPVRGGFH